MFNYDNKENEIMDRSFAQQWIKGFAMLHPNCLWQLLISARRYLKTAQKQGGISHD